MKVLVIQTAFLGDAILATAVVESLHTHGVCEHPHVLVRKGNAGVFAGHPFVHNVIAWDKHATSTSAMVKRVRSEQYDVVVNIQRYFRTGWVTIRSGARETVGFDKSPLSRLYTRRIPHLMDGRHEVDRNQALIAHLAGTEASRPRVYPTQADYETIAPYLREPYVCIAPASVWFTKQYPAELWIRLIMQLQKRVWLLGGPDDVDLCASIVRACEAMPVQSLAGKLSVLQSAALMQRAEMSYVNDSAALHMASAVDATVTAVFCSTIPEFGFGPLSTRSSIVETTEVLACRPCGIHGRRSCPEGHFHCANTITAEQILNSLPK